MAWLHGGSLAVWYLAFAVLYFRALGPLHNPLILAFGHFVCLPLLLLGICGVVVQAIPATAGAVDAAVEKGITRRRWVFGAGALGGLGAMLAVALLGSMVNFFGETWGTLIILLMPLLPPAGLIVAARWVRSWTGAVPLKEGTVESS